MRDAGSEGELMEKPSPAVLKKIQALAQIAADLRQGKDYNITRLTLIKSLCADPDAAAKFALHIAKLAQRRFKARPPSDTKPTTRQQYGRLIAAAIPAMTRYLKSPTEKTKGKLLELCRRAKEAQSRVEHQQWGDVRIIECWELLIVETAMDCLLSPWHAPIIAYQVARQYAEKYDAHYGTGLIPKSAPMVEEIAEFWGQYYSGAGMEEEGGSVRACRGSHQLEKRLLAKMPAILLHQLRQVAIAQMEPVVNAASKAPAIRREPPSLLVY